MNNCLSLVVLMFSAAIIPLSGLAAASTNVAERLPVAKWDFEGSDGLVMKKCSICNDPERGKCLKLVSYASRATARTMAKLPEIAGIDPFDGCDFGREAALFDKMSQ